MEGAAEHIGRCTRDFADPSRLYPNSRHESRRLADSRKSAGRAAKCAGAFSDKIGRRDVRKLSGRFLDAKPAGNGGSPRDIWLAAARIAACLAQRNNETATNPRVLRKTPPFEGAGATSAQRAALTSLRPL